MSLTSKVTAFIAAVVAAISLVSTSLSISTHAKSIEREIIARGITLAESLSRAVDEGLASENLEFIKTVSDIVHTHDVKYAQVFTTLWLAVDAYPIERLNDPPDPAAVAFYQKHDDHYYRNGDRWIDFYSPVFYHPSGEAAGGKNVVIGYVRLKLSTEQVGQTVRKMIITNILVSVLLTLIAAIVLDAFIKAYVLKPILSLHDSVSRHREGEFPETVPVRSSDEIGELSEEFNQMSRALREREARLAEEKERLSVTLSSIGDSVIVTDTQGAVTMINGVAEHQTGWTAREAIGKRLSEVFHIVNEKTGLPCDNPVEKVVASGVIVGLANHTALIRKDGRRIVIEDSAAPIRDRNGAVIGVVLVFRDVTEKQRVEEELFKVEKLHSVGLLAGGLAHDFNNLLTSILGNISMAKRFSDPGNPAYARLVEAEKASRRAADLTHQLLTFSKGGAPITKTASIVDIIREAAGFALSGTAVAPRFEVSEGVWSVDVDAGQINRVFSNLIINAVQAMERGGTIVIAVGNIVLSEREVPTVSAGPYVKISVRDTGTGILEEDLARIFDPYFTTKQKGSGLGLTTVYSIVKKHHGHITVESKPGEGTTFTVYLPAAQGKAPTQTAEEWKIAEGQGSILVMDDEEHIRDLAGEMLRSLGYDVDFAKDGEEAVQKYQKASETNKPYDVVIMDLVIPGGLGGKDAIRRLCTLDPKVKAIVSSGYSNDPIMAEHEKYGFRGVITKPYSIGKFSAALHDVLKVK